MTGRIRASCSRTTGISPTHATNFSNRRSGLSRRAEIAREYVDHIDFATPFEQVVRAFQTLPTRTIGVVDVPPPVRAGEGEEPPLTDEEIEAILAAEGASPPAAGQPAPRLDVVRREPGQGHFGKWVAWLLIFFMVAGAIKAI